MATPEHDTWLCVPTANSLFFLLSHYILFPPPSGIKGCLNTSLQYIMLPVKTGKRQGLSGSLCLVKKEKKKTGCEFWSYLFERAVNDVVIAKVLMLG